MGEHYYLVGSSGFGSGFIIRKYGSVTQTKFEGGKDVFIPPTNYMFMENVKTFKPLTPG